MAEKASKFYKYCMVPGCRSTTVTCPNKSFLHVPRIANMRKKWLEAMGRDRNTKNNVPLSMKSARFCCEDHFDLENDMQNYIKWKMMGGNMILKKGVVPHFFDCQNSADFTKEPQAAKAVHISILNDSDMTEEVVQNTSTSRPMEWIQCGSIKLASNLLSGSDCSEINENENCSHLQLQVCGNNDQIPKKDFAGSKEQTQTESRRVCSPQKRSATCILSRPIKLSDANLIITSVPANYRRTLDYSSEEDLSSSESRSDSESNSENQFEAIMLKGTMMSIQRDPKLYLGISNEVYSYLDTLCRIIPCHHKDVLITLKKIRLNEPCTILAMQFATSAATNATIEAVFQQTVSLMSKYFKEFIHWPTPTEVFKHLPILFRARYSNVQFILDILEVEIQKPDDPLHQHFTWSEDKKFYSIKYIISCTPDGLINYTSSGFGGRTSDTEVLKNCGLLEHLSPGMDIIADRTFKTVDHLLAQRSCKIIRLPAVCKDAPRTKEDVTAWKRIEVLRNYVQKVVGRLRSFKMLTTCVDSTYLTILDDIVVIVSGLINLQNSFK